MTELSGAAHRVEITPYRAMQSGQARHITRQIDDIFFEASSVQSFRDAAHRQAFRWLWLGRYLCDEPEHAFLAHRANRVVGYLVGSLSDPAPRPEFLELSYFVDFASETQKYPAHVHINVASGSRSCGIGERLIAAFEQHARANDCPGVHVVTGAGMRNVHFYSRIGFQQVARAARNGGEVVMLAKAL